jgi:integrase
LPANEMPAFLKALCGYDGGERTRMALELLILTAVRPGELRGIRWEEIDLEKRLWRIPGPRMKMKTEHIVPLSAQAMRLLEAAQTFSGNKGLVFRSPFYPGKPLSDGTLNSALVRLGYKGKTTAHGFRTLFSTWANESGWNADVIERQLAHQDHDEVRATYNLAQWLEERKSLMSWWADAIDAWRKKAGTAG